MNRNPPTTNQGPFGFKTRNLCCHLGFKVLLPKKAEKARTNEVPQVATSSSSWEGARSERARTEGVPD